MNTMSSSSSSSSSPASPEDVPQREMKIPSLHSTSLVNVSAYLSSMPSPQADKQEQHNEDVPGVFAVEDSESVTQYIGMSKRVLTALQTHLRNNGPDMVRGAKIVTDVNVDGGLMDKQQLQQVWKVWIQEYGKGDPSILYSHHE